MPLLKDERHNNNTNKNSRRPQGRWKRQYHPAKTDRDIDTGKAEMLSIVDVLFSCDQEKKTEGQGIPLPVPRNVTNKNGSDNKLRTITIIVCEPKNRTRTAWAWDLCVGVWVRGEWLCRGNFSLSIRYYQNLFRRWVDGVVAEHNNNNSHKHSFMARLPLTVHNGL